MAHVLAAAVSEEQRRFLLALAFVLIGAGLLGALVQRLRHWRPLAALRVQRWSLHREAGRRTPAGPATS